MNKKKKTNQGKITITVNFTPSHDGVDSESIEAEMRAYLEKNVQKFFQRLIENCTLYEGESSTKVTLELNSLPEGW
jgi:ubiquitin